MSLTARLSAFFLGGLAGILAGFSVSIYFLADDYLKHRERDRVQAALDTLRAMTEVDHEGIEWEGRERGVQNLGPEILWTVHVGNGVLLDRADVLAPDDPLCRAISIERDGGLSKEQTGSHRRGARRHLHVESPSSPKKHSKLALTVAISTKPRDALLQRLALALAGVSVGIWILALIGGRWYCRRALRPVSTMANQAQTMRADDDRGRLAVAASGDELQALGRSFNGLLDRLHEALERQRRFTGDASHQLRTPLAGLLGQVEIALRRDRDPEEYRRTLEQVRDQGEQLRRIVEMLLFLARADAEARVDDFDDLDLATWLPEQVSRWETHPRRSDLRTTSTAPCKVKAHGALLGQLLDNLIDNAFKYSEPGTPVTVRLECTPNEVLLIVEDDGVGIQAADLPRLFEPFYRSSHARTADRAGVGLGLSVAKRIAEMLGGKLTAEARAEKGSRFTLTLPTMPASPE